MSGPIDLLEWAARHASGTRPLVVTSDAALDFDDLSWLVDRRCDRFADDGIRAGTVHPLTVAPDLSSLLSLLALWRMGVTPAPLNAGLTRGERERAVELLASAVAGPQAILWTSGTSGTPRGVALSADNLLGSAEAVAKRLDLSVEDRWLASLSPAHVGGLALLTRPFLLGGSLVLPGTVAPERVARLLSRAGFPPGTGGPVTHMSLVPTQLIRLLDHLGGAPPPPSFRCLVLGGAHTPAALLERALSGGWPVALTYGMTEMSSQVCTAAPDTVREAPGSVGRPLDGVEVRIAPGGEVLTRGRTMAIGYVGDPAPLAGPDGWYRTGDLGHVDEEGRLWVTGRRSDRIITGGVTVSVREIEEALRVHPDIADVAVAGIPDAEWGDVVGAVVVPVEGTFDLDAVDAWVREQVGPPRRPRRWCLVAAIPLNANGKVDRKQVRALLDTP